MTDKPKTAKLYKNNFEHTIKRGGQIATFRTFHPELLVTPEGCIQTGGEARCSILYRKIMSQLGHNIEGMAIHHTCFNGKCINPDHLEVMTHSDHKSLHGKLNPKRKAGQQPKLQDNRDTRWRLMRMPYKELSQTIKHYYPDQSEVSESVLIDILLNLEFISAQEVFEFYNKAIGLRRCQKISKAASQASRCIRGGYTYPSI